MRTLALATLLLALPGLGQAYTLVVNDNNPVLPEALVRQMTLAIGAEVGALVPDTPLIKVLVTTRAKLRQGENKYIYLHRVELTKQFNGEAPYPFHGWLPIKRNEFYGVADDKEMQEQLQWLLRAFFTELKAVDPRVTAP